MSKEKQTIHEFDLNVIYDYFSNVERQGPGSQEITLKALSFIDGLTENSKVVDIGCGTGGQTMVLAQNIPCEITGVELWSDFINQFNQNAQNKNLHDRMKGIVGNMENLPFKEEYLDLIWSEGAIYNIGFKRGLNEWRKFLKQGGYIAVTENTWFTEERPIEIQEFWQPNSSDKYFSKKPHAMTAKQQILFQVKQGKGSKSFEALKALVGMWPGDETDEEFEELTKDL